MGLLCRGAAPGQGWGEGEASAMARRCPSTTPEDHGDQQLCPTSAREAGTAVTRCPPLLALPLGQCLRLDQLSGRGRSRCPPGTGHCLPPAPKGWALPMEGKGTLERDTSPAAGLGKPISSKIQLCQGSGSRECHRLGDAAFPAQHDPSRQTFSGPAGKGLLSRRCRAGSDGAVQGCSLSRGSPHVRGSSCRAAAGAGQWEEVAADSLRALPEVAPGL